MKNHRVTFLNGFTAGFHTWRSQENYKKTDAIVMLNVFRQLVVNQIVRV